MKKSNIAAIITDGYEALKNETPPYGKDEMVKRLLWERGARAYRNGYTLEHALNIDDVRIEGPLYFWHLLDEVTLVEWVWRKWRWVPTPSTFARLSGQWHRVQRTSFGGVVINSAVTEIKLLKKIQRKFSEQIKERRDLLKLADDSEKWRVPLKIDSAKSVKAKKDKQHVGN